MKFAIQINEGPYTHQASDSAYLFAKAALEKGHEIFRVMSDGHRIAHWIGADWVLRVKCWPIILAVPWGLTIGPPPPCIPWRTRIFQEVLDPIVFGRTGEDAAADSAYVEACHNRVLATMQDALTRLYAERDAAA